VEFFMNYCVSPQRILRAVDIQLREFLTIIFGGAEIPPAFVGETDYLNGHGAVLDIFIDRYNTVVTRGAFTNDVPLRHAFVVQQLRELSQTTCCTGIQLRAALALVNATSVPGYEESIDVFVCRAEIESELNGLVDF